MLISENILKYKQEIIDKTVELVKIPSYQTEAIVGKPFGEGPYKALEYILALAQELGFETFDADGYAGHVDFGTGDEIVGVLCHLDVVPEGEGWHYPPYGGVIENGKIYGRGTADNKSPGIAALYSLLLLKEEGIVPKRKIRLIYGCNEESGMKDMEYYFNKFPVPDLGFSPDGDYPITNREKGIIHLDLIYRGGFGEGADVLSIKGGSARNVVPGTCTAYMKDGISISAEGMSAHASTPELGHNAIIKLFNYLENKKVILPYPDFIKFLQTHTGFMTDGKGYGINMEDEVSGRLTLNMGTADIDSDSAVSTIDIRYPVTADGDMIIETIRKLCVDNRIDIKVVKHERPLYVKEGHILLKKLASAYEAVTGKKAELISMGGGTYARCLKGNGVAFGPGFESNMHQPDESVDIEQLMEHSKICTQAIYELACI